MKPRKALLLAYKALVASILIVSIVFFYNTAFAACSYVWSDHDFNAATPAVQKQVCDRSTDLPAIKQPSIRPIQQPTVKPVQRPVIAPIGTTRCWQERIFENGTWKTKQICR